MNATDEFIAANARAANFSKGMKVNVVAFEKTGPEIYRRR